MAKNRNVVVGYDGSKESKDGIRWAAAVANRREAPLRVVSATGVNPEHTAAYRAGVAAGSKQRAITLAREGAERAQAAAAVDVEAVGVEQGATAALVNESENADLVVLGSRGRGRLRGALLGSHAFSVAMHAHCPVAVVRGSERPLPSEEHPIVVGVDGSQSSVNAVNEAAKLASETGATLKIVSAYDTSFRGAWIIANYPANPATDGEVWQRREFDVDLDGTSVDALQSEVAQYVQEAADQACANYPDITIEMYLVAGRPERALVDVAEDASLIVVGARGRGDFASLLLGSVTRDLIHHADCAVYLVR